MAGVTTAIVVFILLAQAFPWLIKNKTQYYLAFATVIVILLLDALAHVVDTGGFIAVVYFFNCVLQASALIFIFLATGGLSPKEFADEVGQMIEVVRRGETTKEVIVPLSESAYRAGPRAASRPPEGGKAYVIDDAEVPASGPATAGPATPARPNPVKAAEHGPLPLD
ncbi:MAG: hypothetical protein ABSG31_05560 [Tepidisphaeraceae bacterium]